jgi:50S ribosomal subunit-associated GTPase HflX
MEEENTREKIMDEIHRINRRLDALEDTRQASRHKSWASSVWALVPITAIVMWGFVQIFQ